MGIQNVQREKKTLHVKLNMCVQGGLMQLISNKIIMIIFIIIIIIIITIISNKIIH